MTSARNGVTPKRISRSPAQRQAILNLWNASCACGADLSGGVPFDLDHMHQLALGGPDTAENLRPLCIPCHTAKTAADARARANARRLAKARTTPKERAPWRRQFPSRPLPSRPFDTSRTRRFDGTVTARAR